MRRYRFITIATVLLALLSLGGCRSSSPPAESGRRYEVRGQVLGVRPEIREIRLAHEEIPGYMPAMSMSFGVKDVSLLTGLQRGDLVRATMVVTETDAWLSAIEKAGHGPVAEETEADAATTPARPAPDLLEPGQPVPDETFTDQHGRAFHLADTRGTAVALTFIYTRCPLPNFCPRMDRNFLAAQRQIAARAELRDRVQLLSVTFDPAFDTPAVLAQHASSIGADLASWRFLTADQETIDAFATRFGVAIVREVDGRVDITHNLRTAVIAPDGRIAKIFSGTDWTADELVATLAATLGS
jgi:protein SCO1/2